MDFSGLSIAFELMITGMATVFVMLLLVVLIGKVTITVINKTNPEKVQATPKDVPGVLTKNKLVAISTAVNIASGGQAKILKIERV